MTDGYRNNVGLVILKNSLIFAGFRSDIPENAIGGWQMPQGGIEPNEDIIEAGYREMFEETGIEKNNVKLVKLLPETIKYDFSKDAIKLMEAKNKKFGYNGQLYKGQKQHWIVFEFLGNDCDINLHPTEEPQEFSKFKWETSEFLQNNVIEMKQNVYKELFRIMKENNIDFK